MSERKLNPPAVESDVRIHLIFCPRRTRNIFDLDGTREQFEAATANVNTKYGVELFSCSFGRNFVCLYIRLPYQMTTKDLVYQYKLESTRLFHEHIPELKNTKQIWSSKYLAMTDEPSKEGIASFVARHWIRPQS